MKRNPIKEVIISTVAATVGGYLVKKGFQYLRDNPLRGTLNDKPTMVDKTKRQINKVVTKIDRFAGSEENSINKGIVATVAYTLTVFGLTKMLRRVI